MFELEVAVGFQTRVLRFGKAATVVVEGGVSGQENEAVFEGGVAASESNLNAEFGGFGNRIGGRLGIYWSDFGYRAEIFDIGPNL